MSRRPISAAHLERKLRAICGLAGSNPLPDLEDLAGLLVLENDRPEWRLPAGDRLMLAGAGAGAVASETSWVTIENPAESGTLVIVWIANVFNTEFRLSFDLTTGTLNGQLSQTTWVAADWRDLNAAGTFPRPGVAILRAGNDANPAPGATQLGIFVAGGPTALADEAGPFLMPAGTRLVALGSLVNGAVQARYRGYERPLEGKFEIK